MLIAAIYIAASPGHSESYGEIRRWLSEWLTGRGVYANVTSTVDYPPQALVLLRPLTWLPHPGGEVWFAIANAVTGVVLSWALVAETTRLANVTLAPQRTLQYVLVLMTLAPVRINIWNGQLSMMVQTVCLIGVFWADRRPLLAGIALGLGSAKPHVVLPFLIFLAFARHWKAIAVAVGTAIGAALLYCISVWRSPFLVLQEYWLTLYRVYGAQYFVRGEVDARSIFLDLSGSYQIGEPLFLAAASMLGAWVLLELWRVRRQRDAGLMVFAVLVMTTMSVFPFMRYGLMLAVPAILALRWQPRHSGTRRIAGWALALIAIDVPFVLRHLWELAGPVSQERLFLTNHVNRVLMLGLLIIWLRKLDRVGRQTQVKP